MSDAAERPVPMPALDDAAWFDVEVAADIERSNWWRNAAGLLEWPGLRATGGGKAGKVHPASYAEGVCRMKLTREQLERSHDEEHLQRTVLELALHAVLTAKPDAIERAKLTGQRVELRAYHLSRAHGGLIVRIDRIKGQKMVTSAYYLDALRAGYRYGITHEASEVRNALDRIILARARAEGAA